MEGKVGLQIALSESVFLDVQDCSCFSSLCDLCMHLDLYCLLLPKGVRIMKALESKCSWYYNERGSWVGWKISCNNETGNFSLTFILFYASYSWSVIRQYWLIICSWKDLERSFLGGYKIYFPCPVYKQILLVLFALSSRINKNSWTESCLYARDESSD